MKAVVGEQSIKLEHGLSSLGVCAQCEEGFLKGEEPLLIFGDIIHEDCFYDYSWRMLMPKRIKIVGDGE